MTEDPGSRWLSLELDSGAAAFYGLPERLYLPELEEASVLEDAGRTVFLERVASALERAISLSPSLAAEPGILRFLRRWPRYADLDRYLRVGNAPFAREVARALLAEDSGDPPPRVALAALAIEAEGWDEAARHLAVALERAPEHALTRFHHALVLAGGGQRQESLEELERLGRTRLQSLARFWRYEIAHRDPDTLVPMLRRAFVRLPADAREQDGSGDPEFPAVDPGDMPSPGPSDNPELAFQAALHGNDAAAAEARLTQALAADPDHLPARIALADLLVNGGRPGEALPVIEAGLTERPFAPELHAARGRALERMGRRDEALEAYRAVFEGPLALIPGPAFLASGNGLLRLGARVEARDHFTDAAEARPGDPLPHRLLAVIDEATDGAEAAERRLREVIRVLGRHPLLEYALGDLLRRTGRRVEAEGIMKVLVRRHPRSPWGHRGLGDLVVEGDPPRALEHYARALRLDPNIPIPGYDYLRGVGALRAGDPRTAERALERAAAGEPDNPRTWCDLGAAYFMNGKIAHALGATETALRLRPGHPGFLHNLAAYHAERFRRQPWKYPRSAWWAWRYRKRSARAGGNRSWERDLWRPGSEKGASENDAPREGPPPA